MEPQLNLCDLPGSHQNLITQGNAIRSAYRPQESHVSQDSASTTTKEPSPGDNIDCESDTRTDHPSSPPNTDATIWEPAHASLEQEFRALKAALATYLALQTRIFRDVDGGHAEPETGSDWTPLLSDAIDYIQCLKDLQGRLVDERSILEAQVRGWEGRVGFGASLGRS